MRINRIFAAASVCAVLGAAQPAAALNIVLSNDDGFESANIRALYQTLKAAGHSVILSAPTQNQSGKGAAMNFLAPIGPLTTATRYATVPAGAPGVGTDPNDPDIHYVDGTPVMSLLYGLDVLAPAAWGGQPDLVVSGPNEGNNLGSIVISSGTVGNALYGIGRGIPAIAVSAADSTARSYTSLVPGDVAFTSAAQLLAIIDQLEATRVGHKPLLPRGTGLNVNLPAPSAVCTHPVYAFTELGLATATQPVFYADISTNPYAAALGITSHLPGIGIVAPSFAPPAGVVLPTDPNPAAESNAIATCRITVSTLRAAPQATDNQAKKADLRLTGLPQ